MPAAAPLASLYHLPLHLGPDSLAVAASLPPPKQTREAISHARAAGCPMVVAITKCDSPHAQPDRVRQQLIAAGLELEEVGGSIQVRPPAWRLPGVCIPPPCQTKNSPRNAHACVAERACGHIAQGVARQSQPPPLWVQSCPTTLHRSHNRLVLLCALAAQHSRRARAPTRPRVLPRPLTPAALRPSPGRLSRWLPWLG